MNAPNRPRRRLRLRRLRRAFFFCGAVAVASPATRAQDVREDERPPINYSHRSPQDAVALLLPRIARGEIRLTGSDTDILRAVLRELQIPIESQLMVFSRTSLQTGLIRPKNPRAIYFSDSVYVGWVPGGLIEVAAVDPTLGPIFYAFDPQDARDRRRSFVRETSCLRCHGAAPLAGIPSLIARSVFTGENGEPLRPRDAEIVDDRSPFERRWGGWYVTGYLGKPNHRGNAFAREHEAQLDFAASEQRPADLSVFFDTSRYLAPTSDIVAHLIFEHQLAMHNSLTRAADRVRRALASANSDSNSRDSGVEAALAGATEEMLDHLLFRAAAPLPDGIKGDAAFLQIFTASASRNHHGDALKDLSLRDRLFSNRCSFLIYSPSFSALPTALKDRILDRLAAILHGDDPAGRYAYLEKDEKSRIDAILVETHPEARRHLQSLFP